MEDQKLRRQICFESARLLHARRESDFTAARWRAVRSMTRSYVDAATLPTDREIRIALQDFFPSRRDAADTIGDRTTLPAASVSMQESDALPSDRFDRYLALLQPLDRVRLPKDLHPEGDLLYHSLQVFELAYEARPWDEDFVLAALLHDVGKGIDPFDGHAATMEVLYPLVSERTFWFIEHLPLQHGVHEGTIGIRARRRIRQHEDAEELRTLAHCDSDGRVPGYQVRSLPEALGTIRDLTGLDDSDITV